MGGRLLLPGRRHLGQSWALLPFFLCERELLQDEQGCSRSLTPVSHASCHPALLPVLLLGPSPAARHGPGRESWRDKAEECPLEWLPLVPWRLGSGSMVAGSFRNVLPRQGSGGEHLWAGLHWLWGVLALGWSKPTSGDQAQGGGQDGCRFAEEAGSSEHWRPGGFALVPALGRGVSGKENIRQMEKTKKILHRTSCQESRESSLYLGACVPEHLNPQ